MELEFDPEKDAAKIAKHGMSLSRAADFEAESIELDPRFASEQPFRAFGLLDGLPHSFAFTIRGTTVRAISLRRAHAREYRRYVEHSD